jgi:5-methylcytosine-specific restriction endonuclease McrA
MGADPYKSSVYQRNRRLVLEASGWRCSRCGAPANTVDHIRQLIHGGTHDLSNLRPMCKSCNSRLGAQDTNARAPQRAVGRMSRRW